MNMQKLFSLFFLTLITSAVSSQITYKPKDSISFANKKYQKFQGIDVYENLFFTKQETLIKTDGNTTWEYANLELGIPESISLLNPLQVLVFYKNTNTFVLLDRFLSEIKRINLNNITPARVAQWIQNTKSQEVWLFNSLNNELEFFNYQTNTKRTDNIPVNGTPIDLTSGFNSAYLLFKNKIKGYDNYGTSFSDVPVLGAVKISLNNKILMATYKEELEFFNIHLNSLGSTKKPKNTTQDVFLSNEKLYIYTDYTLYVYQLIIPSK